MYRGPSFVISALTGADGIPGMLIPQACSTSTTCLCQAGVGIETELYENTYCMMTDRASNGPHTIWLLELKIFDADELKATDNASILNQARQGRKIG